MSESIGERRLLHALRVPFLSVDMDGRIDFANQEAESTFAPPGRSLVGLSAFDLVGSPDALAHAHEVLAELLSGGLWQGDLPLRRSDGSIMTAGITASPLRTPAGGIAGAIGILEDVTEQRAAATTAREAEERLRLAHEAAHLGTWQWHAASGVTVWDEQLEAIFGLAPGGFDGTFEAWSSLIYPEDRTEVFATVEQAMADRAAYVCQHRVLRPDGSVAWVEGVGQVTLDDAGEATGTIGTLQDVTERVHAEQANKLALRLQLEAAARADLLHRVTADLARTETVEDVGEVLREHLHDSIGTHDAGVFLPQPLTGTLRLATSYGYGEMLAKVEELAPVRSTTDTDQATAPTLTGEEIGTVYPFLDEVGHLLGDRFLVAVPIRPATPSAGVVLFGFEDDRPLSGADRVLLTTLAGQVSIAVERSDLLRRTREIAEQLQSSMAASPLPQVPGIELAAHYAPGGDELEHVGGDWYDAVETSGRGMAIVVGDVMGRGVHAATTMIRIRGGIRGLLTVDPTPDVVLESADRLLNRDAPEQFVTAMCVLIDPASNQLFISNAGHVPAVVIRPGGEVDVVDSSSGVPLGVPTTDPRQVLDVRVEPGTTVVLVTDGVVESRGRDVDEGIARLVQRAAELYDAPLDVLVAELGALAEAGDDDDVTVVAARLS